MFRDKLYYILTDLSRYNHSRAEVMALRVEERLDSALNAYSETLSKSVNYLKYKDCLNVLKKMNRG